MKTTIISIITLAFLMTSCSDTATTENTASDETATIESEVIIETEVIEVQEEVLLPEGTAVEGDDRYQYLSDETTMSDCYIVSHFIDMDIEYITVDFVTYELDKDSENTDYEIYNLINENPKLRTFMVLPEYKTCGRNAEVSASDLIKTSEDNPQTIFRLETETGMVSELYIDTCSG